MAIPSTDNYILGRGRLFFSLKDPATGVLGAERPLGNAPEIKFSINAQFLDHFNSMSGFRAKDKSVPLEVSPTFSFTLDEFDPQNVSLLVYGALTEISQSGGDSTLAITSPLKGSYYDLGFRSVGSVRVTHGSVTGGPFVIGETITGGTSSGTAEVIYVGTGYLLVRTLTGTLANAEVITGGTSSATATTTATPAWVDGLIALKTTSGSTLYTAGTDYTVDYKNGRLFLTSASTIVEGTSLTAIFAYKATSYTKIDALGNAKQTGMLRYISDNPEGPQMTIACWSVVLKPDGDTGLITQDWATMSFKGDILKDEVNHPESPYMQIITDAVA